MWYLLCWTRLKLTLSPEKWSCSPRGRVKESAELTRILWRKRFVSEAHKFVQRFIISNWRLRKRKLDILKVKATKVWGWGVGLLDSNLRLQKWLYPLIRLFFFIATTQKHDYSETRNPTHGVSQFENYTWKPKWRLPREGEELRTRVGQ